VIVLPKAEGHASGSYKGIIALYQRRFICPTKPSYFVVVDSNVWVAERLLQTSIGGAFLYALASGGAFIGLPQVVEMEVNRILEDQGEKAVADLRKGFALLRQLSGHQMVQTAPSAEAIRLIAGLSSPAY
jgi:hypothetical protein